MDELNELEIAFIANYNTQIPNGYNILPGGKNSPRPPMSEEAKDKLRWDKAQLTKEEIIFLRKAYANHEMPSKIYHEKYEKKMHYNSFLNIWCGARYANIMTEVFQEKYRHTKLNIELVKMIRHDREELKLSYMQLAKKYNIPKGTIADVCTYRTWKNV